MKSVAIIGLGWLGMPLGTVLRTQGFRVTGSKTHPDGVAAARLRGIESYPLTLTPELVCQPDDLRALMQVSALVITLPASRTASGGEDYLRAVQRVVNSALTYRVAHFIFTSSTSVYGNGAGIMHEHSPLYADSVTARTLQALEFWLHRLQNVHVDILRLGGLVGPLRHPGRFLAGKTDLANGAHGVNLVHLDDVIAAISLLLQHPAGQRVFNLCAAEHPARRDFYPAVARQLALVPPMFLPDDPNNRGKIIDGSRICRDLGFRYRYPDPSTMPLGGENG